MNIEPVLFFEFTGVLLILCLALAVFTYSYANVLKKLHLKEKESDSLKENLNKKATAHLEVARHKAYEIIEEATKKGAQIITESKTYDDDSKQTLRKRLLEAAQDEIQAFEKISQSLLEEYKQNLSELKIDNINILRNISKDIERDAIGEIKDFKTVLQQETLSSQKVVEGKLEEEYKKVQDEIKAYKEQELKKINDSIYEIVGKVSRSVLGKALSLKDQEDLVIEALEKAKKEKVL